MSEYGDWQPSQQWRRHDFGQARRDYDRNAGRSYAAAQSSGKRTLDLVEDHLTSESETPVIIVTDHTGSMGERTTTIFSKLGYYDNEVKEYLGDDAETCFAAVGDKASDTFPFQVRPFASGTAMRDRLKELVIEGKGGNQRMEDYQMAALYFARKASFPKAVRKPILIFIGDEAPHPLVDKQMAKQYLGLEIPGTISTQKIFQELTSKFAVYLIHLPYGCWTSHAADDEMDAETKPIYEKWVKLIGRDHIVCLNDPARVVDCIFGILGEETDQRDYFEDELKHRQLKDDDGEKKVATVLRAMETVHRDPKGKKPKKKGGAGGQSRYHGKKPKRRAKRLLDD